jgi:hypothetical protein
MQIDRRLPLTARKARETRPRVFAPLSGDRFDIVLAILAVALFPLLMDIPLGHDQSWYLISVQKILAGARPYVDVIELNPPLNFYLVMPAVYLADLLGMRSDPVFIAYVILLAFVSTVWARRLLLGMSGIPAAHANIAAVVALLSTTALVVFDFGQRDVMMVIFTLPYLALAMRRIEGEATRPLGAVAVGLWAALGICLKHYFLIFPLATEIALYVKRRRLAGAIRPEVVAVGIACVGYALAVVTLFPAYLETIVPLARLTYFAYGVHFPLTLLCAETLTFPLVFGAYLAMRRQGSVGPWLDMLGAWTVAAFVSYAVQNRGFSYHADPLRIMLVFMAVSLVARKFDVPLRLSRICLVAALALIAVRVAVLGFYEDQWASAVAKKLERYDVRDGLYTFTAHVFIGFPLANRIDGPWDSRFPCLWPVPGVQRILAAPQDFTAEQVAAAQKADRYVTDAVIEDFERRRPSIVIVDARKNKSYFAGVAFDYVAHFKRDPRFARLWSEYRLVENHRGFEIWRREPGSGARG